MTTDSRQLAKLLVRILITAGLLICVFSRIDLQQFWQTVKTARWEFLIAVWGLAIIIFWINSINMQRILKKQSCDVGISTLFGATSVTLLYSMIIPGMLSTGIKWYILKKDTGKGSNVLSSMLYNQFVVIFVTTAFGLVALIVTNPADNRKMPVICSAVLIFWVVCCLLLLSPATGPKFTSYISFILKPLPAAIRKAGDKILEQLSIFQTARWSFHFITMLLNFISGVVFGSTIYFLAARAAHITVPFGIFVWLCAAVFLLGRLPISIANLGVREITLVGTLAIYGVDAPSALLMSMIIFSIAILMAIIGAIYQLYWISRRTEKSSRDKKSFLLIVFLICLFLWF